MGNDARRPRSSSDVVAAEIARWEAKLAKLSLDAPLYVPLSDHELGVGSYRHHSIAFDRYGDRWRLIEVEGNDADPTKLNERPLVEAPRDVRLEALRRLPRLFEAAATEGARRAGILQD
jgi:hypothetical protein